LSEEASNYQKDENSRISQLLNPVSSEQKL